MVNIEFLFHIIYYSPQNNGYPKQKWAEKYEKVRWSAVVERRNNMSDFSERRKYKRWYNPLCDALISEDGLRWANCEIKDISAGGLRFNGGKCFAIGQTLFFRFSIYCNCSEFSMKLNAQVVHSKELVYGVKFLDITSSQQIQLDEIINSAIEKHQENLNHHHKFEDGIYTFCFKPARRKHLKLYR